MERDIELREYYRKKYLSYQNRGNFVQDMNPLIKLNVFFALAILGVLISDWRIQLSICLVYYVIAMAGRKLKSFALLYSGVGITFFVFLVIVRQLSVEGSHVMFSILGWKWTWEGLQNAISMTLSLWVFSGAIILFFDLTEIRDLMYSLEMKGMSHVTSYVILASLQTSVDLKRTSQTIMDSQRARGVETEGNILVRVRALIPVLSPLFLSALASTEEKAVSMDARAFSVERAHTFLRELRPTPKYEVVIAVLVDICLAAVILLKITGRIG